MNTISYSNINLNKSVSKANPKNGNAEIYVLSPDILQKLGINLEDGLISQEPSRDATGIINNADIRKDNETILETADLMKKSIFLSPTFSTLDSNISGELEMANLINECKRTNTVSNVTEVDLINARIDEPEIIEPIVVNINETLLNCMPTCHKEIDQQYVHDKLKKNKDIYAVDHVKIINETNSEITTHCNNFESNENLQLNCYASDIINISNKMGESIIDNNKRENDSMQVSETQILNNYDKKEKSAKTVLSKLYLPSINKISLNTISEEKYSTKSRKPESSPNRFNITPNKVDIALQKKGYKDIRNINYLNSFSHSKVMHLKYKNDDMSNLQIKEKDFISQPCLNSININDVSIVNDTKKICLNILDSTSDGNLNEVDQRHKSSNCVKFNSHINSCDFSEINDRNIDVENTREAFKTSNNFEYNRKEFNDIKHTFKLKEYFCESDQLVENINFHVMIKEPSTNSNIISVNSKSHLQGVEKPGGDLRSTGCDHSKTKILKTYERRNKVMKFLGKPSVEVEFKNKTEIPNFSTDHLNEMNIADSTQNQKFCVCGDFGKLEFYDNDSPYEHIHFWEKNYCADNVEIIYSIYYDEIELKKSYDILLEDESNKNSVDSETYNNICWNYCKLDVDTFVVKPDLYINSNKNFCSYDDTIKSEAELKLTGLVENGDIIDIHNKSDNKIEKNNMKDDHLQKTNEYKKFGSEHSINSSVDINNVKKANKWKNTSKKKSFKTKSCEIVNPVNSVNASDKCSDKDKSENICYETELKETCSSNISSRGIKNTETKNITNNKTKSREISILSSHLQVSEKSVIFNTHTSSKHTKCGVCQDNVETLKWLDHIAKKHNYIAWNDTESALDVLNEDEVKEHLNKICKQQKGLICSNCSVIYKYVNSYMKHVKKCEENKGIVRNSSNSDTNILEKSPQSTRLSSRKRNENDVLPQMSKDTEKNSCKKIESFKNENNCLVKGNSSTDQIMAEDNYDEIKVLSSDKTHSKSVDLLMSAVSSAKMRSSLDFPDSVLQFKSYENKSAISAVNRKNGETDVATYKEICSNDCTNIKKCTPVKKKDIMKKCSILINDNNEIQQEPSNSSRHINNRYIDNISKESFTNNTNKKLLMKQDKQKRKNVSEEMIKLKDEGALKTPNQKKNKESKAGALSTDEHANEVPILTDVVKCGVCSLQVSDFSWLEHISKEHNYLAWKEGTSPIDLNDEHEVENHLKQILKQCGELICKKCGCKRKYIKPYMSHVKVCNYQSDEDSDVNEITQDIKTKETNVRTGEDSIVCGVCDLEMKSSNWLPHIQKMHHYKAWIKGEKSLDLNNQEEVQNHLMSIGKKIGGLKCAKCGLVRKYVKTFLQHVKTCRYGTALTDGEDMPMVQNEDGIVQCAVCSEKMDHCNWKHHAMTKHYNVAWLLGEIPIDLKNFYAVNRYLDEYKKKYNKLVCKVCRISRVSCYGFYAHILFCGKTEEETEMYKNLCEICNNKYICIYKHQHMAMHREQIYAQDRKLKFAEGSEKSKEQTESTSPETPGRRKAAEKAKDVLTKYKAYTNDGNPLCKKCGFEADDDTKLEKHFCQEANDECSNDSDVSVKLEHYSEDESADTDVDSNVSNEDHCVDKKRKKSAEHSSTAAKVSRLPYSVKNVGSYIRKSYVDLCQKHLTSEPLFSKWRSEFHEVIGKDEISKYMPTVKVSCKVRFNDDDWNVYDLFQASAKRNNHIVFVGGIIQCLSWAPCRVDDIESKDVNYLAVASHSGFECPNYRCDEITDHSNLIQIWDFGNSVQSLPKFAFGIAHDYGTVWSLDWCPSGTRDLSADKTKNIKSNKLRRLGLLAMACSNGSAYIFSVPYPETATEAEKPFYRMKPVVELRLSMTQDKRKCQATSLTWSSQKGHGIIIVGYSDGVIAFYDLNSDSPFLTKQEDGVTIIYPYHDERSHSSCIIGVGSYAGGLDTALDTEPARAWSTASSSGARACAGLPGRTAVLHTQLASTAASFTPHWPSVQLTGDSNIGKINQTVNELEWCGGGRRIGGARTWCACVRCGLSAAAAPPLIRAVHAHPAHTEIKKMIIGTLDVASIGNKRKHNNDDLAIKLEPFNYEGAVKQYGLEFKLIPGNNKLAQQKAAAISATAHPERYPLADITCMAFGPSAACHDKLAIGTQAGIILFINI